MSVEDQVAFFDQYAEKADEIIEEKLLEEDPYLSLTKRFVVGTIGLGAVVSTLVLGKIAALTIIEVAEIISPPISPPAVQHNIPFFNPFDFPDEPSIKDPVRCYRLKGSDTPVLFANAGIVLKSTGLETWEEVDKEDVEGYDCSHLKAE
ncbi:MAG: hypothetical protein F6K55_06175 [Moorea sp. SIO4A3]|nr:hypothetical protein [Moorena sp. SIO4A3]